MSEGNGKPVDVQEVRGGSKYTLAINWDVGTDTFYVAGLDTPPWAALGMLRYMEILVRRREAKNIMLAAAQNAPRIARPGGLG